MRLRLLACAVMVVLSGCSAPEYRAAVISFGAATEGAAKSQSARLNSLTTRQVASIRGALAEDRVNLSYSSECALLAVPGSKIKDCTVIRRDNQPIAQPETFTSILALNKALGEYGASLSSLAADIKEDDAKFRKSLTDLAAAYDGMNASLSGSDQGKTDEAPRLQALASITGGLTGTLFAGSRVSKLREIIVETDPTIQSSTKLLTQASEALAFTEVGAGLERVERARDRQQRAILSDASVEEVGKRQSELFEAIQELKRAAAVRDSYKTIGETHKKLADASRNGASAKDLQSAILEIVELVKFIQSKSGNL